MKHLISIALCVLVLTAHSALAFGPAASSLPSGVSTLATPNGDSAMDEANKAVKTISVTPTAGADAVNNVQKVEQRFSFANIVLAAPTTTVVKSGAGFLHAITFNKPVATGTLTCYDNTAASGTLIGTITTPASPMPVTLFYDVTVSTGLTCVTGPATIAQDITVSYR